MIPTAIFTLLFAVARQRFAIARTSHQTAHAPEAATSRRHAWKELAKELEEKEPKASRRK